LVGYSRNMVEICWEYGGNIVGIWWRYGKWCEYDGYMVVIYGGDMVAIWWRYDGDDGYLVRNGVTQTLIYFNRNSVP
jgi:hypothetical protein